MPLSTQAYTDTAAPILEKLRRHFGGETPIVSDVVDKDGLQYVNLVQEGGGVLGVALVGYTYVLEQMGIRFMKMAGTSAGAINTMMLSALGPKNEEKSLKILEILDKQNLFDFVDGDPAAKNLIKRFVTSESYFTRLRNIALTTLILFNVALFGFAFTVGSGHRALLWIFLSVTILTGSLIIWAILWLLGKRKQFYNTQYGINPGRTFLDWVSEILQQNNIKDLNDLRQHIERVPEGGFRLRHDEKDPLTDLNKPKLEDFLVLVSSDITNQMKVEFPRMWNLYWTNPADVNPAYFVRASMAVPVFFKPFIPPTIDAEAVFEAWKRHVGVEDPSQIPSEARFVDGGIISNFPINVFYNPSVKTPRLPTFGILLDDVENDPAKEKDSFLSFAAAMFNTVRSNYDKDFLIKNADFKKTIGRIDVRGINWLNFNISDPEKLDLFRRGAEAAARFFMGEAYDHPEVAERAAAPPPAETEDAALESFGKRTLSAPAAPLASKKGGFQWDAYKDYRTERKKTIGY